MSSKPSSPPDTKFAARYAPSTKYWPSKIGGKRNMAPVNLRWLSWKTLRRMGHLMTQWKVNCRLFILPFCHYLRMAFDEWLILNHRCIGCRTRRRRPVILPRAFKGHRSDGKGCYFDPYGGGGGTYSQKFCSDLFIQRLLPPKTKCWAQH